MAYFSPTSILTDAQKVPCTFELAVPHLKPLNSGSSIDQGTKLDLPLWMGEMLALDTNTDPLATMEMPTALGHRVMNALRADPKSVDIRAQAQWFYGLGERMLFLFEDDEMVDVLTNVCQSPPFAPSKESKFNHKFCRLSRNEHTKLPTRRRIHVASNKEATAMTSLQDWTKQNGYVRSLSAGECLVELTVCSISFVP